MAILIPGHFAPARTQIPAAAAASVPNPQGAQSAAPLVSNTQDTQRTSVQTSAVDKRKQPSVQNRRRRTEVLPDCIANGRPKRTRKRVTPQADSVNAPYRKLTPILDNDPNAMDIDEVKELRSGKSKAADAINDPIIVSSHPIPAILE
jgi:hypothetical protein